MTVCMYVPFNYQCGVFRFHRGNFRDRMYVPFTVGLSVFVQEIPVTVDTYVPFTNQCGAFHFRTGNFCKRDGRQASVGFSI